jgi:hypothetical protein
VVVSRHPRDAPAPAVDLGPEPPRHGCPQGFAGATPAGVPSSRPRRGCPAPDLGVPSHLDEPQTAPGSAAQVLVDGLPTDPERLGQGGLGLSGRGAPVSSVTRAGDSERLRPRRWWDGRRRKCRRSVARCARPRWAWRTRVAVILNLGRPCGPGPGGGQPVLRPLDDQLVLELGDRGQQEEDQPPAGVAVSMPWLSARRATSRACRSSATCLRWPTTGPAGPAWSPRGCRRPADSAAPRPGPVAGPAAGADCARPWTG